MGYDGGFMKIRMKINTQNELKKYELELRSKIYKIIGRDNFYKFEGIAIDLPYLDNSWKQVEVLRITLENEGRKIMNYEVNENHFTLITRDELGQYISDLYGEDYSDDYFEDIKLLEHLYNTFDWKNDTLVFCYSY